MGVPHTIAETGGGLTSGILPMISELLSQEPGCNVVDLGVASTGNCMLLSHSGARVCIDTSDESLRTKIARYNELEVADIDRLVTFCPTPIDVLLFWDLMDYLSLDCIKAVMNRFSTVMRTGGLLYTLASRQRYISDKPVIIEMLSEERVRFLYEDDAEREAPQYAPKQLEQLMPGFVLEKMYLMQNGMQENLFLFEGLDAGEASPDSF